MDEKKIALISYHNAYNYGAGMQAYALQEKIKEMGYDCEYIDYINPTRKKIYSSYSRIKDAVKKRNIKSIVKTICTVPFVTIRGRKFKKFYKKYLSKTVNEYSDNTQLEKIGDSYYRYIVGSDQVWNYEHNGGDSAYLLGFVKNDKKKISYSSSFGMDSIPDDLKQWYGNLFNRITYISTREKKGVELIKDLTGEEPFLVLDPVFLVSAEKWKNLIGKSNENMNNYIFCYSNAKVDTSELNKKLDLSNKCKHILSASLKPTDFFKKNQKIVSVMAPENFISEILNSDLVITTSFHCLAFSIILHKKFIVLLSGDEGRDERLINLLEITGLSNRIYNKDMTCEEIYREIDYESVDSILKKYIEYSEKYLFSAINQDNEALKKLKGENFNG